MESRFETTIFSLITAGITAAVIYGFGFVGGDVNIKLKIEGAICGAVVSGILVFLIVLSRDLLKSNDLPDKARRLSYAQRLKITNHLAQYSSLAGKGLADHILTMSYDEDAKDAELLGADINDAMKAARWFVDVEFVGPDRHHSEGLWLYGQAAFTGNPPECDLLQDAFRLVGLRLRFDQKYRIGGTHIAIGRAPDKCFTDKWLGGMK